MSAVVSGEAGDLRDLLAAVTPGGGKSVLPLIAASRLIQAGIAERVCWIVPRDSLRLQAEEALANPNRHAALGHALSVRAAENAPDPCRGLAGYVTTHQAVAANGIAEAVRWPLTGIELAPARAAPGRRRPGARRPRPAGYGRNPFRPGWTFGRNPIRPSSGCGEDRARRH